MARGIEISSLGSWPGLVNTSTLRSSPLYRFRTPPFRVPMRRPVVEASVQDSRIPVPPPRKVAVRSVVGGRDIPHPPVLPGSPLAGLAGYGSGVGFGQLGVIGCGEVETVVDKLGVLLKEIDRLNITGFRAEAARAFHKRESSFLKGTTLAFGESCRNLVNEGKALINDLNQLLTERGAQTLRPPEVTVTELPKPDDVLKTLRWVGVAVGVVMLGAIAVPAVKQLSLLAKSLKRSK